MIPTRQDLETRFGVDPDFDPNRMHSPGELVDQAYARGRVEGYLKARDEYCDIRDGFVQQ
jgi:hypothetical protein